MREIYLSSHLAIFIEIDNCADYKIYHESWGDYNRNAILFSVA